MCGLQSRDTTPYPWSVTCPACRVHEEYQAAARLVSTCQAHKVPTLPGYPCPTCASPPGT